MLGRRFARKAPSRVSTGDHSPASGALAGNSSPLERNTRSPKGWKKRESDGVGLGIVANLERAWTGVERPSKIPATVGPASAPIPIGSSRTAAARDYSQVDDFLSFCYLCRKKLHGMDIYMYRGEKAFCSMECRYQQIVSDEFHEKCGSEILRRAHDASSSPCSGCSDRGRLFFTGVVAA